MKFLVIFLCWFGLGCCMTPKHLKQFINENKLQMTHVTKAGLQEVSAGCKRALMNQTSSMEALKYIDNTGKPASGLLNGNTQWLGNFAACLKMTSAHYCYTSISVNSTLGIIPIYWGVCVPKECTESDVTYGLEAIVYELNLLAEKELKTNKPVVFVNSLGGSRHVACYKESTYSTGVIITLTVISVFIFMCLAGTLLDMIESLFIFKDSAPSDNSFTNGELIVKQHMSQANGFSPQMSSSADDAVLLTSSSVLSQPSIQIRSSTKNGFWKKILLSFSLIKNTDQLMNTNVAQNSITCINGVRVISMFWVILGHTFLFSLMSGLMDNALDGIAVVHKFSFMAVSNALFSVDSFFFLSGLLVGYLGWRRMEKNDGKLPLFAFYFHRFWRLTPVYMFVILFYDKLNGFLGHGPVWFRQQSNAPCDKNWWTNLLYINNFYPTSLGGECLGWSWYLANDMQFYVISPIILILAYKWKSIGAAVSIGSLTLLSIITTGVIIYAYDVDALLLSKLGKPNGFDNHFTDDVYVKPYCRITPYLVGLLVGYLFHTKTNFFTMEGFPSRVRNLFIYRERSIGWIINGTGWFLAAAFAVLVLYGPYSEYKENGKPFTLAENIFYGSCSRFVWGVALAWVVYACHNGYGGQINRFLSAHYWIPLSRLTYGAYLVHPIVINALYVSFETPVHFTMELIVFYFIALTALSYGAAYILAVFVELPLANLEKLFLKM